jgi:hypothetical protein
MPQSYDPADSAGDSPAESAPEGGQTPADGEPDPVAATGAAGEAEPGAVPGPATETEAASPGGPRVTPVRRGWRAWRRWRRSRPFWAGVLLILAGAELLLLPLPLNSLGLVIHVGIGGIAGILIGAVLIVCALLIWFNPAQHTFYSIVAVLLAIAALIASNLGGFFIGTLLGVIGGSLGFAWTSDVPPPGWPRPRFLRRPPADAGPSTGLGLILGDRERPASADDGGMPPPGMPPPGMPPKDAPGDEQQAEPATNGGSPPEAGHQPWPTSPSAGGWETGSGIQVPGTRASGDRPQGPGGHRPGGTQASADRRPGLGGTRASGDRPQGPGGHRPGGTFLALNVVPVALTMLAAVLTHAAPAAWPGLATPTPTPTSTPGPTGTPTPTATSSPSPSPTSTRRPSPSPSPTGTARVPGMTGGSGSAAAKAATPSGVAAAASSTLTAGSATMAGLSFDGVADVPTASGPVAMLKFSMSSLALHGGTDLTVTGGGHQLLAQASSLDFSGNVTLFTTSFSGELLGIRVTFTPQNPPPAVLPDMFFTDVVSAQPYTTADSVDESGLQISGS